MVNRSLEIEKEIQGLKKQIEKEGLTDALEEKIDELEDKIDELEDSGELPEPEAERLEAMIDVLEHMENCVEAPKEVNARSVKKIVDRIEKELAKLKSEIKSKGMVDEVKEKLDTLEDEIEESEDAGEIPGEEANRLEKIIDSIDEVNEEADNK